MFGLPWSTTFFIIFWPLILFVGTLIYALRGSYEGQKEEKEFDLEAWYRTF